MQRTLLMIKPDIVAKKMVGEVISLIEKEFDIIGICMKKFTKEEAQEFYKVHKGKPFYDDLIEYITSGPVVGVMIYGENVVKKLRDFVGNTDPKKASFGTLRQKFGENIQKNAVHASDSIESAEFELKFFFKEEDFK